MASKEPQSQRLSTRILCHCLQYAYMYIVQVSYTVHSTIRNRKLLKSAELREKSTMAAINLLVREPVIPFIKVKKDEDLEEVTLSNTIMQVVNVGGVPMPLKQNRTAMIVKCMDDDIETLIRCCNTFLEATTVDALSLSEGQYYTEFRTTRSSLAFIA